MNSGGGSLPGPQDFRVRPAGEVVEFSAAHRHYGDHTVVSLSGDADVTTGERLRESLLGLAADETV